MKSVISITIEVFALLISLLISFFLVISKRKDQKDGMILKMVSLTVILLISDILAYGFRGNTGELGWYIVRISNFLVFTTNYLMLIAYGKCLRVYTQSDSKKQCNLLYAVWFMAIASIIMLIVSQFYGFLYYFDGDNLYHRTSMFILTQVAPVVGGIIYMGILLVNRKKYQKNVGIALAVYLALPYLATLFQIFVYGYPAQTVACVIGCWGLFLARELEVHNLLEEVIMNEKEKQNQLEEALTRVKEQYSVLKSMAEIYYSMHLIDLANDTVEELNSKNEVQDVVNKTNGATKMMSNNINLATAEEYKNEALSFTDLTTLADRMQNKKMISDEFIGNHLGWYQAVFIVIEADASGKPTKVVFTTQSIDEEKRQRETLIYNSRTDQLTGLNNRRAYEEDILKYDTEPMEDDFVYICFDVNGLKRVNDTLGHASGDELIIGACECMKKIFEEYGNLYRTGGDEFIFIGRLDEEQLDKEIRNFDETVANWSGKLITNISVSYGVVTKKENAENSIDNIAVIADQRMYASKRAYYQEMGNDRRRR
ncbi:MAG: GGDEF domain-containing protein [Lachnospiraceae bacterium]